jgi:hypothetical protein
MGEEAAAGIWHCYRPCTDINSVDNEDPNQPGVDIQAANPREAAEKAAALTGATWQTEWLVCPGPAARIVVQVQQRYTGSES